MAFYPGVPYEFFDVMKQKQQGSVQIRGLWGDR